ncbi:DUF924 family protein [Marinobacterium jannaschii]|uniref:DUF924 family protein n=1 Tax=Marinobacterium jannaschii TaxID=64970 RepID=UPI0004890078|nr:DUF924 family protein [Marinobacterium jannaschii]
MAHQIDAILEFWFGEIEGGFTTTDRSQLWWMGNPEQDLLIGQQFGYLMEPALGGELDHWADAPRGRLALIILLDQFTRNIYRGTAKAFSGDAKALGLCKEGIELGHDRKLAYTERTFFYMPLEHAEDLDAQERCIKQFQKLVQEVPDDRKEAAQGNLDFAHQHRNVIVRFGRFPHRNEALGRSSSEEELEFLEQLSSRWGQ